ncbi:GSCFA domain-containing protein [Ruegeria sp. PrR005]|uniref:GSCFA domain-containing protein n=1 Tax=Ruegeria sp. PrR005 TaxID=2706882 RepID=UPI00351A6584
MAEVHPSEVTPVVEAPFTILESDKIATAGSCFAQHIANHLSRSGYNYLVTENANPRFEFESRNFNYGVFTARYGNIYTSRQLVQLFDRAYGNFEPEDVTWKNAKDQWVDPFRPQIQPNGFESEDELLADRQQHFARVREAFESLDYFVFTLGLTECWRSKSDGAVFPVCPGVSGGEFSPEKYEFHNLSCSEVVADMTTFIGKLRYINPHAKVILTVSPVPLIASASSQHVLPATVLSKSILRVAADQLQSELNDVFYFPSYEIITGSFNRGQYFGSDLRSVTPEGVAHVMSVFMRTCTDSKAEVTQQLKLAATKEALPTGTSVERIEHALQVVCDEEALDAGFNVALED